MLARKVLSNADAGNGYPSNCIAFTITIAADGGSFLWPSRSGTYNAVFDWGDGVQENITSAPSAHIYDSAGVYDVVVTGVCPYPYFNNSGDKTKVLKATFNGSVYTPISLNRALWGCSSMTEVDMRFIDGQLLNNLELFSFECASLRVVKTKAQQTPLLTSFRYAFARTDIDEIKLSHFSTQNVSNFYRALYQCTSLIGVDASGCRFDSVSDFDDILFGVSTLSQQSVDSLLSAIYASREYVSWATPSIAFPISPTGTYQNATPPTTGKEYEYKLENDPDGEGFNAWSITY